MRHNSRVIQTVRKQFYTASCAHMHIRHHMWVMAKYTCWQSQVVLIWTTTPHTHHRVLLWFGFWGQRSTACICVWFVCDLQDHHPKTAYRFWGWWSQFNRDGSRVVLINLWPKRRRIRQLAPFAPQRNRHISNICEWDANTRDHIFSSARWERKREYTTIL